MPQPTAELLRQAHAASLAAASCGPRRGPGTAYYHPAISWADTLMYLLDEKGWAFSEIGVACDLGRRAVYQRVRRAKDRGQHPGPYPDLPDPPRPLTVQFTPPHVERVPDDVAVELRALRAQTRPGVTTPDHPAMRARLELARTLHELHMKGVPVKYLADALGVVSSSVSHRLTREGYDITPGGPRAHQRRTVPHATVRKAKRLRAAGIGNRNWLPECHPARVASRHLDGLLAGLVDEGYLPHDIGRCIGMDGSLVRMRVNRHHNRVAPLDVPA
jgi:hypothetical protein